MDLVTRFIFDPRNQLFVPLEEERLTVQPNPHPPPHIKLKHFRLAGEDSDLIRLNHFYRSIQYFTPNEAFFTLMSGLQGAGNFVSVLI